MEIYKRAFTHTGIFHADDVFSAVLLSYIYPEIIIERGMEVPENYDGLVFDIGLGEYDHHQIDNETRANGIQYASFGKLWKKYGNMITTEDNVRRYDSDFVQIIDYIDNGGKCAGKLKNGISVSFNACTIYNVISEFNPSWDSDKSSDEAFKEAVAFATKIFNNQMEKYNSRLRAKKMVKKAFDNSDKHIVELQRACPWQDVLIKTTAEFVIFPSSRGGYIIQAVPIQLGTNTPKISFPERWLGADKEDLSKEIEGFTFCHKGNFLASAETKEQAFKVAKKTIEEYKKDYKNKVSSKDIKNINNYAKKIQADLYLDNL